MGLHPAIARKVPLDDVIDSLVDVITTYRTGKALSDEQLVRTAMAPLPQRAVWGQRWGSDPQLAPTLNLLPGFVSLTPPHRRSMGRSGAPPRRL